jgi:hypothetical protein
MPIQLYTPETRYTVASLALRHYPAVLEAVRLAEGFVSLTRDKEEITLIVDEAFWRLIASRFPDAETQHERRMIRFDTVLDFSVVGFIAEISKALAEAGISILSISTYRTDAVLVHESQFNAAIAAVKRALLTLNFTHLSQH